VYNLLRNVGGSIGIATVMATLVRGGQRHQTYLAANLDPSNPKVAALIAGLTAKFHMSGADAVSGHGMAMGVINRMLVQQSALMAYADNFRMLGYLALLCLPLVLLPARPRHQGGGSKEIAVE
jgi:DHA2 family multidrug resistance protein